MTIKPEDITEWVEYGENRYGVLPNGDQVEFLADGTPKVWKRIGLKQHRSLGTTRNILADMRSKLS